MAADTTAEAAAVQRQAWARLGPEGRVRVAVELSEAVKRIALAGLAQRHPGLNERELMHRYIAMVHGVDMDDPGA